MDATAGGGFLRFFRAFEGLDDPRAGDVTHPLREMVVIAILGAICGCDGWARVELLGRRKHTWLATFLDLPGVASPATTRSAGRSPGSTPGRSSGASGRGRRPWSRPPAG